MEAIFVGWAKIFKVDELRYTSTGTPVLSFSFSKASGKEENKVFSWYKCTAFAQTAEYLNGKIQKESKVFIIGRQSTKMYQKKDGTNGVVVEIAAIQVDVLDAVPQVPKEEDEDAF